MAPGIDPGDRRISHRCVYQKKFLSGPRQARIRCGWKQSETLCCFSRKILTLDKLTSVIIISRHTGILIFHDHFLCALLGLAFLGIAIFTHIPGISNDCFDYLFNCRWVAHYALEQKYRHYLGAR